MLGIFENVEETKLFDPIQVGTWSLRNSDGTDDKMLCR